MAELGVDQSEAMLIDETVGPPRRAVAPLVDAAGSPPRELDQLLRLTLTLFAIGFAVWILLAGTAYRREYSGNGAAWHRGAHNFIEITLVREDQANLSCAAGATLQGLHCRYGADRRPRRSTLSTSPAAGAAGADGADDADADAQVLRPYNTVNGELFLGAGLWDSLLPRGPLPAGRFTVTCDFEIIGALRSVALRWTAAGTFEQPGKTLAVGTLHDCAIPP
jgi:hypothetical protein